MVIGNILDTSAKKHKRIFKKTSKVELDKPLLIVGWKKAKELFPSDFNINKFEINENAFWTCQQKYDRYQYENNLIKFEKQCIEKQISKFNYTYYDLIFEDYKSINFNDYESVLLTPDIIYIRKLESIIGISSKLSIHQGYNVFEDLKNSKIKKCTFDKYFKHLQGYKLMCFED